MMGHTHMLIGGLAWLAFAAATTATVGLAPIVILGGYPIAAFAALIADIDTPGSRISRMLGPIGWMLSWVVRKIGGGHRKITHSILGFAIMAFLVMTAVTAFHIVPWIGMAFLVGYAAHVLADMVTKSGCPLLWPISKHNYGLHLITTNKMAEHLLILPGTLVLSALLVLVLI